MAYGIVNVKRTGQTESINVSLGDVSNATATAGNKQISLKWADPEDATLQGGATLASWAGTVVVRKAGSAPADRTDGTVVLTSTTRNAYSSTPYVDTGLTNGTVYYYRFFPYSQRGVYTDGTTVHDRPHSTTTPIPTLTVPTEGYTYDGSAKTPTLTYNSTYVSVSGESSATNAGNHTVTFTLKGTECVWADGSYAPVTKTWSIAKATGSVSVDTDAIKLSMKKTSDTVTITQIGNGTLSITNGNSALVSAALVNSNTAIQIARIGTVQGTTTVTLYAAESSNYTAAEPVTITVTAYNYKTMTVTINEADSNPATCCTYYDDALEMEAGSDAWDEFFGHYPVLFKDGQEVVKINPNNFAQDINGNSIDITSGNSGDVMIAFPRRGLTMSKTGDIVTIKMTDDPDSSDFEYMAHRRGDTQKDVFYIGAYPGVVINDRLRSISGRQSTVSIIFSNAMQYARNNTPASDGNGGSGYDIFGWYQSTYIICMYVLKYKNLNSQLIIGYGNVQSGNGGENKTLTTGETNTKGMDWGTTSDKVSHMKLFGIEDLWGNTYSWIGGAYINSNFQFLTATENFNNSGSNYINRGSLVITQDTSNYVTKIHGDSHTGFLVSAATGSSTTYYCDLQNAYSNRVCQLRGQWDKDESTGIFQLSFYESPTRTYIGFGAVCMYL